MLDTNQNDRAVGLRLKQALDASDHNQTTLAEALEVSSAAVSDWIKTGKIARERLVPIREALHISIDWLLTGEADAPPPPAPPPELDEAALELAMRYVDVVIRKRGRIAPPKVRAGMIAFAYPGFADERRKKPTERDMRNKLKLLIGGVE